MVSDVCITVHWCMDWNENRIVIPPIHFSRCGRKTLEDPNDGWMHLQGQYSVCRETGDRLTKQSFVIDVWGIERKNKWCFLVTNFINAGLCMNVYVSVWVSGCVCIWACVCVCLYGWMVVGMNINYICSSTDCFRLLILSMCSALPSHFQLNAAVMWRSKMNHLHIK